MAKKEKKDKSEKKKNKKEKAKEKRSKRGRKGKARGDDDDEEEAVVRDNWLYYSEGPLTFLIAVLLVLCVLDTLLAGYALVYTKRIEKENRIAQEEAAVRGPVNGTTWFLLPDGTYVHADGSLASGSQTVSGEPQLPLAGGETGADEEGEASGTEQSETEEGENAGEAESGQEPSQTT